MRDIAQQLRTVDLDDGIVASLLDDAADEIDRLRRAVKKMAAAAGPAWIPRWIIDAPWFIDDAPDMSD